MRSISRNSGTSFVLTLITLSVLAQGTGSLEVRVLDDRGEPRAGVEVTLRQADGRLAPQARETDSDGVARFGVLYPDSGYSVEARLDDLAARAQDIRVPVDGAVSVSLRLTSQPPDPAEVPVSEDSPPGSTRFPEAFVRDLPVHARFYQYALPVAPGVNDADADGNPTVHGSSSRDFRAMVHGVANVDPMTSQFMDFVNSDSVEDLLVIPMGAGVEFGRAQGGFARVVQHEGTNTWHGSVSLLYRSSDLDGSGRSADGGEVEFRGIHPGISFAGPFWKDRVWGRFAWEKLDLEEPVELPSRAQLQLGGTQVQTWEREIHAHQLTFQLTPKHRLALQYREDPLRVDNYGVDSSRGSGSTQVYDTVNKTTSLVWTMPASSRLLVETTFALQDRKSSLLPMTLFQTNGCVVGLESLERAFCNDYENNRFSGSLSRIVGAESERWTVASQATWQLGSLHQLRLGVRLEGESYTQGLNEGATVTPLTTEPRLVVASYSIPSTSITEVDGDNVAVYAEATLRPTRNLGLTVGARLDSEDVRGLGRSPFDPAAEGEEYLAALASGQVPPDQVLRTSFTAYEGLAELPSELSRVTGLPEQLILASLPPVLIQARYWVKQRRPRDGSFTNNNFTPALSLSWDPWGTGRDQFALSARRFYDTLFPPTAATDLNPVSVDMLFDARPTSQGMQVYSLERIGEINAEVVDPNLSTPYQDEWFLAYQRELWPETTLRASYLERRYRDQLGTTDINRAPGDYGRCRVAGPTNTSPITASPGSGFEITDPFTGEVYTDTDPGDGDGRIDDCSGGVETIPEFGFLTVPRPDGRDDPYTLNPGWGAISLTSNTRSNDYEAVILDFVRRQHRGWAMQASYVWSRHEGSYEVLDPFVGLDRRQLDNAPGNESSHQRHVVKIAGTGLPGWGLRLGGLLTWESGLPFSRLEHDFAYGSFPLPYLVSQRSQQLRLRYTREERNTESNGSRWLLDFKIAKDVRLKNRLHVELSLEVFNLFDDTTTWVYNPDFETGFSINGIDSARSDFGRRWQLGLRLIY